jgi:hypothetical protein
MSISPTRDQLAYMRMIQELLQLPEYSGEHRRSSRQPFPTFQSIAPDRGEWPAATEFERVRCFDLSTSGFSFLRNEPFPERRLIVGLGAPPDVVHLTAEVMHETPLVLVGCRFTGRVE